MIHNYPADFITNKYNPKCQQLIFANLETKDQFLRNGTVNNKKRLNKQDQWSQGSCKSSWIGLQDFRGLGFLKISEL